MADPSLGIMLVSAAVCPHPPAIVPDVSQGAWELLSEVRTASIASIQALVSVDHDLLVCVGAGPVSAYWGRSTAGTLRAFGVDVTFGVGAAVLPPALTIAAYLLQEAGAAAGSYHAIAYDAAPDVCAAKGRELAACASRVAMLVMGDASAKRTEHSPGYVDPRAEGFDAGVAQALSQPDPAALLAIDPGLASDLWVAGRPAWQVLAGALGTVPDGLTGHLSYDAAPLGVGYVVVQLA